VNWYAKLSGSAILTTERAKSPTSGGEEAIVTEATTPVPFRIFFFSDWRLQPLDLIEDMLRSVAPVDLVVYGGDDTDRFVPRPEIPVPFQVGQREYELHDGVRAEDVDEAVAALRSHFGREPLALPNMRSPDAWYYQRPPLTTLLTNGEEWPLDQQWVRFSDLVRVFTDPGNGNWLSRMAEYARHGVVAVIGNDCRSYDRKLLDVPGVREIHSTPAVVDGWGFVGVEGAICDRRRNRIGYVLHTEGEVRRHLKRAVRELRMPGDRLVVVSHTPPAGSELDSAVRFGVERLGSETLRDFVLEQEPVLVLCGHCHSAGGKSRQFGETLVVNGASDDTKLRGARAAVIELLPGQMPTIEWVDPSPYSVAFLPRIGPERQRALAEMGITRAEQLFSAPDEVFERIQFGPTGRARLEALQRNEAIWLRHLQLPQRMIYYDVETGLQIGGDILAPAPPPEVWMLAAYDGIEMRQWIVPDPDRKARADMYQEFLEFVKERPEHALVSWSGTRFDERAVEEGLMKWRRPAAATWPDLPKLDLLTTLRRCLALPLYSWSLKDVASWCGFDGYSGDIDGFEVGFRYEEYRRQGVTLPIEEIARYNLEDVQALAFVAEWARTSAVNPAIQRVSASRRTTERVSSPYKGVRFDNRRVGKPWRARIRVGGKDINLGSFATPEEAARTYDAAVKEYRGSRAVLNFPDGTEAQTEVHKPSPHQPRKSRMSGHSLEMDPDSSGLTDAQTIILRKLRSLESLRAAGYSDAD
jgi:Icc-related predicted phosphoesterase/uncharacterized protein YprB with RNaseH-like and TPR domain